MGASVFYQSASELCTLTNTFKVATVPTDPTTISLTITDPTGTATTYTYAASQITRSSAGVYTKDIACATAGDWQYVWTGTGTASDVQAGTWTVFETSLGNLYCTVDALKSRLGIALTDTADDYELQHACWSTSRAIEHLCGRTFYRSASGTARTFVPDDFYELVMPEFNDLVSVSAVATDAAGDGTFETTWDSTDYRLWPYNPAAAPETRPYTRIKAVGTRSFPIPSGGLQRDDLVQVTGVYGWAAVPYGIKMAALIWAADTFKLKDAPFGVAGGGEFGPFRVRDNPRAMAFCQPYRRDQLLGG